jgi:hypothetical protein
MHADPPDIESPEMPEGVSTALGCGRGLLTAARVGLGVLVATIGFWGAYDQTRRAEAYQGAATELLAALDVGIPTLAPEEVTTEHDGRFAHLQGPLRVPYVTDSLTGFSAETWRLARTVELLQWEERLVRSGTSTSSSPRYAYDAVWSARLIDSDDFDRPLFGENEHVNPKEKPYPDERFLSGDLGIGAWALSVSAYAWPEQEDVPASLLEDAELSDGWMAREGFVYPTGELDVRIRYTWHPRQADLYSAIGVPDRGRLDLDDTFAELPLLRPGTQSAEEIVGAAAGTERGVQSAWMMYAWVGLMLLIRPVAGRVPAVRSFTEGPFLRRFLRTGALAAGIVVFYLVVVL